jgi:hypothetical protein
MLLDEAAEKQAERGRGDEGDDEIAVKRDVDAEEARAVLPHHRQHRAGLDHEVEHRPALFGRVQQVRGEDEVAGARHRQELGQAFDDAENERLEQVSHGSVPIF